MDWLTDGENWPNRNVSRFVNHAGTRWHLQQMGEGPDVLLLHGTGATTHSYADMLPLLAQHARVTALDLPGHGFTTALGHSRPTREGVAEGIAGLLANEGIRPHIIVGHSAGAAVSVELAATKLLEPRGLVVINGSFYPFPGPAQYLFPAMAKMLFLNPFVPSLFAARAQNPAAVRRLMNSTGSRLSEGQMALYEQAFRSRAHVEGTLQMMANWDLVPVKQRLASLEMPVLQVIGMQDGTVRPSGAKKTAAILQHGEILEFEACGHLVHEEQPKKVAKSIRDFAEKIDGTTK